MGEEKKMYDFTEEVTPEQKYPLGEGEGERDVDQVGFSIVVALSTRDAMHPDGAEELVREHKRAVRRHVLSEVATKISSTSTTELLGGLLKPFRLNTDDPESVRIGIAMLIDHMIKSEGMQ